MILIGLIICSYKPTAMNWFCKSTSVQPCMLAVLDILLYMCCSGHTSRHHYKLQAPRYWRPGSARAFTRWTPLVNGRTWGSELVKHLLRVAPVVVLGKFTNTWGGGKSQSGNVLPWFPHAQPQKLGGCESCISTTPIPVALASVSMMNFFVKFESARPKLPLVLV